jgi:hypothetical protein
MFLPKIASLGRTLIETPYFFRDPILEIDYT